MKIEDVTKLDDKEKIPCTGADLKELGVQIKADTLKDVLTLWEGRTFSEKTNWEQEFRRITAIVYKRWEGIVRDA